MVTRDKHDLMESTMVLDRAANIERKLDRFLNEKDQGRRGARHTPRRTDPKDRQDA